jgi:hypothetical protein
MSTTPTCYGLHQKQVLPVEMPPCKSCLILVLRDTDI